MPDADLENRRPAFSFSQIGKVARANSLVCDSLNRALVSQLLNLLLFVILSGSINYSFMTLLLRVLLLSAFGCSASLAHAEDAASGKLKYGTWGFDLSGMDAATKPGDDFFRYANGTWIDKTQIPPDKPAYSLRLAMTDLTEQRLHEMMESLSAKPTDNPSTLEEKVGAFYRSFMDEARAERLVPLDGQAGHVAEDARQLFLADVAG